MQIRLVSRLGCLVAALGCLIGLPTSAATVYSNDFNAGSLSGFTGGAIEISPSGEKFLGVLSNGSSATLNITPITSFSSVTVSFDLYVLKSVDGDGPSSGPFIAAGPDYFDLSLGGVGTIFHATFGNVPLSGFTQSYPVAGSAPQAGASATNTLGYPSDGNFDHYGDSTYVLSFMTPFSGSAIALTFIGNTNEAWINEGYGIDNLVVQANLISAPEPASILMLGPPALLLLARLRRRVNSPGGLGEPHRV